MKNNTINNFNEFLFEKRPSISTWEIDITDKIKLILNPILFCINQSLECIISISKNTISTDDSAINTDIDKLREKIKIIRDQIESKKINVDKETKDEYSDSFTDIVNECNELIKKTAEKVDDSVMSENDFINIKNKAKDNKTGEKLEAAIYKTLKDSFGLYQGAIKNYMIASDEYLKIYKQKVKKVKNQLDKKVKDTTTNTK
jgi:hypothetical protein